MSLLAISVPARLPRARTLAPLAALAIVSTLVFVALCDAVGDHDGVTAVDRPVAAWFVVHRTLLEGQAGLLLARATGPAVIAALVAAVSLLLYRRGHRRDAVVLAAGTVLAYGAGALAKYGEHRARPTAPIDLAPELDPSFPSGHVLVLTTVAFLLLALLWPRLGPWTRVAGVVTASLVSLVVCLDRLGVGAHWFTDVAGALALAGAVLAVALIGRAVAEASQPSNG